MGRGCLFSNMTHFGAIILMLWNIIFSVQAYHTVRIPFRPMPSHRYEGARGGMGGGLLHLFRSSVDSSSTSSRKQKTGYCRPSSLSRSSFILRLNLCRKAAMHPISVASGARSRVSYCILLWKHHDITRGTVWKQNKRRCEQKRRIKIESNQTKKPRNFCFF